MLLSYRVGRWNLLCGSAAGVPRLGQVADGAASDPLGTSTASRSMEKAGNLRSSEGNDRAVKAVWNSEGGYAADSASRPRILAVTTVVPHRVDGGVRTMETFVTMIVVLAVVALGVLLIHLLDSQRDERIAAFQYGRSRSAVPGPVPSAPRRQPGRK
jgi:hypothetical protein